MIEYDAMSASSMWCPISRFTPPGLFSIVRLKSLLFVVLGILIASFYDNDIALAEIASSKNLTLEKRCSGVEYAQAQCSSLEEGKQNGFVQRKLGDIILNIPNGYIAPGDGYNRGYDYVKLHGLLPNFEPETPENHQEFEKNTWGHTITLTLGAGQTTATGQKSLDIFLHKSLGSLKSLEHSKEFDIYHFLMDDVYVSTVSNKLFFVVCKSNINVPYPHCVAYENIWGDVVLIYYYSRNYVNDALEIDRTLRRKLSSFCSDVALCLN